MSTWDGNNYYYSGQGVVLIGKRSSAGKAEGLIPVGNVSELKISLAATTLEHKESQTGARAIDLRLVTELKGTLSATLENFSAVNLALALRGDRTEKLAGAVTNEDPKIFWGKVVPLLYAQVSAVTVARQAGPTVLTAFTTAGTPFDYKVNADAGSIQFNNGRTSDGLLTANATTGGTAATAITLGYPTVITMGAVPATVAVGDYVALGSFSGADAAYINNQAWEIVAKTATTVSVNVDTTTKTITFTGGLLSFDRLGADVDYTYANQNIVQAMTQGSLERYLRFEGLNTADENRPVTVDVFKFLVDPTKELSVISDAIQQFVLEGSVLVDPLQTSGSKYFRTTLLR